MRNNLLLTDEEEDDALIASATGETEDDYFEVSNNIGMGFNPYGAMDQDVLDAYILSRNITTQLSNLIMEDETIESTDSEEYASDTSTEEAVVLSSEAKNEISSDIDKSEESKKTADDAPSPPPSRGWYKWLFLAGAIVAGITMGFLIGPYIGIKTNLSIVDNSKALYKIFCRGQKD